jgi:type I restriction enzyme R subunit
MEPEPKTPKTPTEPKEPKEPKGGGDDDGETKEKKVKIKLSDGKAREIQSMRSTMFYVDGKPISAEEFLQRRGCPNFCVNGVRGHC